jgi:hypothetical protein
MRRWMETKLQRQRFDCIHIVVFGISNTVVLFCFMVVSYVIKVKV